MEKASNVYDKFFAKEQIDKIHTRRQDIKKKKMCSHNKRGIDLSCLDKHAHDENCIDSILKKLVVSMMGKNKERCSSHDFEDNYYKPGSKNFLKMQKKFLIGAARNQTLYVKELLSRYTLPKNMINSMKD